MLVLLNLEVLGSHGTTCTPASIWGNQTGSVTPYHDDGSVLLLSNCEVRGLGAGRGVLQRGHRNLL